MTIDEGLLGKAREAGARLADTERAFHAARWDYRTAVRRLHLGGGTLREIAAALGLSHQRVQQIVDEAGGTWWQRLWKSRRAPDPGPCTFCHRPPTVVAKLIAGPAVFICDACVHAAERERQPFVRAAHPRARSSFSGNRNTPDPSMTPPPHATLPTDLL